MSILRKYSKFFIELFKRYNSDASKSFHENKYIEFNILSKTFSHMYIYFGFLSYSFKSSYFETKLFHNILALRVDCYRKNLYYIN